MTVNHGRSCEFPGDRVRNLQPGEPWAGLPAAIQKNFPEDPARRDQEPFFGRKIPIFGSSVFWGSWLYTKKTERKKTR